MAREGTPPASARRPRVDVIVPFAGADAELDRLLDRLAGLPMRPGDRLVVADNRAAGAAPVEAPDGVELAPAHERPGSYHARNAGARIGGGEWLVFVDADVDLPADLLDSYFAELPGERSGVLVGAVADEEPGPDASPVARFLHAKSAMSQENTASGAWSYAQTANCAVRRAAFESIGGFREDVRSGGDADLCFRLRSAGWAQEDRPAAQVVHRNRATLRAMTRQRARHGSGAAWLDRAYPGSFPAASLPGLSIWTLRELLPSATHLLRRDPDRSRRVLLDLAFTWAFELGRRLPNAIGPDSDPGRGTLAIVTDSYPVVSETFVTNEVSELRRQGWTVVVEATTRPDRPDVTVSLDGVSYLDDDALTDKLLALPRLLVRHPIACFGDLLSRRRWAREEPARPLRALALRAARLRRGGVRHLHVHFAAGAALDAMRISRILGIPYSVTAHAYEIFASPANLREKLESAAFVTTGCEYNAAYIRDEVGVRGVDVHVQVMGVHPAAFRRSAPYPGGRKLIAIGRLVEKKGFSDLIEAVAQLGPERVEGLTIVGDGPQRVTLGEQIDRLGLGGAVELAGARPPGEIRELLESADVLVMPAVVAADGDRDSMPVVVKEAMAMELPVIASDEVGLPELVDDEVGRLAPPGDPDALGAAISELLDLAPSERTRLGRAGRERISRMSNLRDETRLLTGFLEEARP